MGSNLNFQQVWRNASIPVFLILLLSLLSFGWGYGTCESDAACPDNSACVNLGGERFECQCEDGFDMNDLPDITIEGGVATVCIG